MKRKRHSFKKIEFKKKEREPLKPLFKKQKLITALSVLLVVLITMTGSFAVFTKTSEGNEYNVVQVGELELSYVDLNDEGNVLQLADSYPISDTDGETSTPYRFSVENTGTIIADYTVKIVDDTDTIEADGCSDNLLDNTYIRYKFDNETSQNLKDKKDATTNEYVIYSGTLEPFESNIHEIRLWINENSPNSILGTHYHGKVVIEVTQNNATDPYERPVKLAKISSELVDDEIAGSNCKTYNDGTDTFLVGQCSQNYVWYSGKLWRVVLKNNETGAVKMVTDNAITTITYNASGNTAFKDSYMDQWLTQEFMPTLHDYEDYLVVDSIWDTTVNSGFYPIKTSYNTYVERTVGTLSAYEYYTTYNNSSALATYKTTYLNNVVINQYGNNYGIYWNLMTPVDDSSVWVAQDNGNITSLTYIGNSYGIRPAVYLKSAVQIKSGSGIQSDPYILEGDIQEPVNGTTLLNTRYSGEYITFNNELYRIVDVENGLSKITAVDKPSELSSNKFHSATGVSSFTDASIKTDLENYYQALKTTNETAYNMIEPNTAWYLGTVGDGVNYKAAICTTVDASMSMNECDEKATSTTANIGLPRVGEMFTSQITRRIRTNFWTLTPFNETNVWFAYVPGSLENYVNSDETNGARPSMYLKSNVVIASNNTGNGTYEKPYSVELGE